MIRAAARTRRQPSFPRNWSALYQQRPAPDTGDYFKAEWFRTYTRDPPHETLNIYGGSDYAVTSHGGDYTVHVVIGPRRQERVWRAQRPATGESVLLMVARICIQGAAGQRLPGIGAASCGSMTQPLTIPRAVNLIRGTVVRGYAAAATIDEAMQLARLLLCDWLC
jgi:hypothetical protein